MCRVTARWSVRVIIQTCPVWTLAQVRRKLRGNQLSTPNKFDRDTRHDVEEQATPKYIARAYN